MQKTVTPLRMPHFLAGIPHSLADLPHSLARIPIPLARLAALPLCCQLLFCYQPASGQGNPPAASFNNAYKPPLFRDSSRLRKMAAAYPAIDKIYRDWAAKNHFPGLAYGIVADGQLIYSGNIGFTELSGKKPVRSNSLFRIASMTKSFTAMAILKLRDQGRLSLEDPVYKYIPEIRKMPRLTADAPAITIRNLMTHSAGFPEDNPWGDRQLANTDEELIRLIEKGVSFSNAPGVSYEYSNLGFALLGRIVSVVSGEPYQKYITKNILEPLGMRHTIWEYTQAPPDLLAHGYRWQNGKWDEEPLLHDGSYGAMGGLITSIDDFSRYVALHIAAWPPRSEEDKGPLKRSSLREMHQPHTFSNLNTSFRYPDGRTCPIVNFYDYGLGWTRDCEGRVYVGHSGGLPGFGSQWRFMPEYGIGVIALANLTYAGLGTSNLAVLDTLIAIAGLQPRQLPPSDILDKRKDQLVQLLPEWSGAATSGIFAVNFFKDYSVDSLRKICKGLYEKAGRIKSVGSVQPENQMRGEFILEGEKADIHVFFTLTPENPPLIQQINFRESMH